MNLVAKPCPVGARGIDSLPFSQGGTRAQAATLKAKGIDFVALYLGVAKPEQLEACAEAGLLAFGVTLADRYDGAAGAAQAKALGLPPGTALFVDIEGKADYAMPPAELISKVDRSWTDPVHAAGYVAGIYVGSPQPLTSLELGHLKVVRYWKGIGRCVDRYGRLAEPEPGWCLTQLAPSVGWPGVWSDVDFAGEDFRGRVVPMAGVP